MTRLLIVDDSRAIRTIVAKHVQEMGFALDEAQDGEEGLLRLAETTYDLVVLDVTMPNLDGPGMLRRMREGGNKTPVLMLTSESKRSIIGDVMKLGIEEYILKPFKPDELKIKIHKVLAARGLVDGGPTTAPPSPASPSPGNEPPTPTHRPAAPPATARDGQELVDVLVIDDMENVAKKLRTYLPEHVSMNSALSGSAAMTQCRERAFRVVLIDTELLDVNSVTLMGQIRLLQTRAAIVGLCLRSTADSENQAVLDGFDDALQKPFQAASIEAFLLRYFEQQMVVVEDSVLKIAAFTGREDRVDRYFRRVQSLLGAEVAKLAAACYDEVIVDLSNVPIKAEEVTRLVIEVEKESKRTGLTLRVVGTSEGQAVLQQLGDAGGFSFHLSIAEARQAA